MQPYEKQRLPKFMSDDNDNYLMFRYACQIFDLMTLDIDFYEYD